MSDDRPPSVAELAEYCQVQAGLLAGRAETVGAEADALLDEIDADIDAIRAHLAERTGEGAGEVRPERPEHPDGTAGPEGPGGGAPDVSDLEAREADLEEKQALVEVKRARIAAFQDLAAAYADLADSLEGDVDGWEAALERVIEFETNRDAPTYFTERETLVEAAARGDGDASRE